MTPVDLAQQIPAICNAVWPLLAVWFGLGLMKYLVAVMRDAAGMPPYKASINKPWSETYKLLNEKRKNDDLIALAVDQADLEIEKPKVTGWHLGDDGEMIPEVFKRKNDDMFHQN